MTGLDPPIWDGSPMGGGRLLIHGDQSADVLLYRRYLPLAAKRSGAEIIVSVPAEMRRLAAAWPDTTLGTEADRACAFTSLPGLFDTRPDMISSPPPLAVIGVWAGRAVRLRGLRDRKSTRLNSSHLRLSRMPSSA